jgi:hypothetical protein
LKLQMFSVQFGKNWSTSSGMTDCTITEPKFAFNFVCFFFSSVSSTNCCTVTKLENCCITLHYITHTHIHVSHSSNKWTMVIPVYVHHTAVCCVFKLEVWSYWNCFNLFLDHKAIWKNPVPFRQSGTETETKNVLKSINHVRYDMIWYIC